MLHSMAAFGLLSAVIQLTSALWAIRDGFPHPEWISFGIGATSLSYGAFRAWPKNHIARDLAHPDMTVQVKMGDLFEQDAHLVVGVSDTFDTDPTDNLIINSESIIGQCLQRIYLGDRQRLDREINTALQDIQPKFIEPAGAKAGKLERYEMGTVAVLGPPTRRIFAVAYTRMGNDLIAQGSVDDLWHALSCTWKAMRHHGQRGTIAIPLIGTEFARINSLTKETLLKMILLSFVAHSRRSPICRELVVVIHPADREKVDMLEVEAYLKTL
ncbi:macro domain-containing protein [Thermomonospora amylolytica]|uniref:macro domain-containing protein n=1 Tax=Thermomonospora amylolytica TaxID=1411117 RepID=UPI0013008B28|nr:macro domain-containing protein [Thermomonospora amylolytica]